VNLLGDNICTINKNTETLTDASWEVDLEMKNEKTMYMSLSRHQNVGQNHDIKIANRSLENVSHFKCLGTIIINQSLIQEEIKRGLNYCNACYHSAQIFSSAVEKRKNYNISPEVLYGCETCTLTLREEQRLRVLENRVLRGIFGPKRTDVTGGWRKLHNEERHGLYSSHV
jgi:hypothetical protein